MIEYKISHNCLKIQETKNFKCIYENNSIIVSSPNKKLKKKIENDLKKILNTESIENIGNVKFKIAKRIEINDKHYKTIV